MVQTSRGSLRGAARETGTLFGAIPYAAPPVGELRYRAPAAAPRWDGVREAGVLGRPLPQPERRLPGLFSEPLLGSREDRAPELTLNVWTPDPGAGGLPVLVWLHGGAFIAGSPRLYDGSAWMRDGVVLVTVGYRLGVEGFVHFEGGDTNVALRDQLAALEWVQEEIAAFGGDPGRVCLAGQSAGAMSLGWLLGSERSQGLFQRAISMSGGVELTYSPEQAARVAAAVAGRAGAAAHGRRDERGPDRDGHRRTGRDRARRRSSSTPPRTATRPAAWSGSRRSATATWSPRTRSRRSAAARRPTC